MGKKIVVLENAFTVPEEVEEIIKDYAESRSDVRVYTNFDCLNEANLKNLFHDLKWCDMIVTETTLLNKYQVDQMVTLMGQIKEPKQIVFTWETTVDDLFEYLENDHSIVTIAHHDIGYYGLTKEDNGDYNFTIINTNKFKDNADIVRVIVEQEAEKKRLKEEAEKKYRDEAYTRLTGQKIRINRILSNNKAFVTLIPDTIVDVVDMSEQDPNPNRGIWVWGDGEPVKLLNDEGYNEYTLITTDIREVAGEVLKMVGEDNPTNNQVLTIIGFISESKTTSDLHWALTEWLDDNGYERRGLRTPIERYICSQLNFS